MCKYIIKSSKEIQCTTKWMWSMSYKNSPNVSVKCHGRHGDLWRPSSMRGLSVEQKLKALEQKVTYRNTTQHIATALNMPSKQIQNYLDHHNRKLWLHHDHFEAFKL